MQLVSPTSDHIFSSGYFFQNVSSESPFLPRSVSFFTSPRVRPLINWKLEKNLAWVWVFFFNPDSDFLVVFTVCRFSMSHLKLSFQIEKLIPLLCSLLLGIYCKNNHEMKIKRQLIIAQFIALQRPFPPQTCSWGTGGGQRSYLLQPISFLIRPHCGDAPSPVLTCRQRGRSKSATCSEGCDSRLYQMQQSVLMLSLLTSMFSLVEDGSRIETYSNIHLKIKATVCNIIYFFSLNDLNIVT